MELMMHGAYYLPAAHPPASRLAVLVGAAWRAACVFACVFAGCRAEHGAMAMYRGI